MRQNLGQHFLQNAAVLRRIAEAVVAEAGDTIVEIGPGHGELTNFMADLFFKADGGKMVLIERDPALAETLRGTFRDDRIEIVEGDVMEALAPTTRHLAPGTYTICGNLPYYLTGHLLRLIGELANKPATCVFTIQKEVAERMAAKPPRMNRLAAAVQYWAEPKIIGLISRKDFSPPPEVDSATIALKTVKQASPAESAAYYKMLRAAFQQPRKTIDNNLVAAGFVRETVVSALQKLGITSGSRPQDLSVSDIARLAETLKAPSGT